MTLFGCRPVRIGPLSVQTFFLEQLVAVCRKEGYDDFHFESGAEQKAYQLDREAAFGTVADLREKGWVKILAHDELIWDEYQPRVKAVTKNEMIRLTKKEKKFINRTKARNPVFPQERPV